VCGLPDAPPSLSAIGARRVHPPLTAPLLVAHTPEVSERECTVFPASTSGRGCGLLTCASACVSVSVFVCVLVVPWANKAASVTEVREGGGWMWPAAAAVLC